MEKEKRFSEDFVIAALLIGLAAGVISGMAIYAFAYPAFQSERWPAWVQAVGSVGAIVAAIYVLNSQHKNTLALEQKKIDEQERRLLLSLKAEIEVRWQQYMKRIGNLVHSKELRRVGAFEWHRPDKPFHVYYSKCAEIGLIKNDGLRACLIETYAELEGLLLSVDQVKQGLADALKIDREILDPEKNQALGQFIEENYEGLEAHQQQCMLLVDLSVSQISEYLK